MQGVDESTRKAVLNRLKRIEGQIRGLQKMVEN
ncbi:MAG TPA: metal-sensing transcriptional repressor, partial [Mesotoga sp.]|nr:metal-sensing transcriptional repressor [Mesotoga sp.]